MGKMDYLKDMPIAVLGAGAVGRTCAADMKLAGREVRLYDLPDFAKKSLQFLDRTGITLTGLQRNLYGFHRAGKANFDMVTDDIAKAIKGAGHIVIASAAFGHDPIIRAMMPHLEDGQVISIFTDNFASLIFGKVKQEMNCKAKVIVGGWSSAPYGARIEFTGTYGTPVINSNYRAITLRAATFPMCDFDDYAEAVKSLPCIDAVLQGDGVERGETSIDIGLSNINPVIHVPASVLGVSSMENWGKIFGELGKPYSMYSHGLCPSICEVQYAFYNEEIALADALGVDVPKYSYESFFSRRSVLAQEYMGLDENGKDRLVIPLDTAFPEAGAGPNNMQHRYISEDVPVGCKIYHELGKAYGVPTPIIDSMILLSSIMAKKDYFNEGYSLEYLGIANKSKEELLNYLHTGK